MKNGEHYFPQTNFPVEPNDRWLEWKGVLNPGDEVYIFTDKVHRYLLNEIQKRALKQGLPMDEAEDIAQDTLRLTLSSFKNFLLIKREEDRFIQKSIGDFVFGFVLICYKHVIGKRKAVAKRDLDLMEKLIHAQVSSINLHGECLRKEIIEHFYNCLSKLKEKDRKIMIAHFLEGYKIKEIAEKMNLEQHEVINSYNKGKSETRDCLTKKGFRDYLNG